MDGCALPVAWADQPQWRILETCFGSGLNFLTAWSAWNDDARRPRILHFVAITETPCTIDDILLSAQPWPTLQPLIRLLACEWYGVLPGVHRMVFEQGHVLFTLCVGDTAKMRCDCEKLADIFTVLQRRFILNLSKELSRGKVSFAQYFLLGYLVQQKFLTMSEIAKKMGHTTAAATGLIDRLENLGYARRAHAVDDRRKIQVQITERGVALVSQIRADMVNNLCKVMEVLNPDEQKMWLQIYEKILNFCQNK